MDRRKAGYHAAQTHPGQHDPREACIASHNPNRSTLAQVEKGGKSNRGDFRFDCCFVSKCRFGRPSRVGCAHQGSREDAPNVFSFLCLLVGTAHPTGLNAGGGEWGTGRGGEKLSTFDPQPRRMARPDGTAPKGVACSEGSPHAARPRPSSVRACQPTRPLRFLFCIEMRLRVAGTGPREAPAFVHVRPSLRPDMRPGLRTCVVQPRPPAELPSETRPRSVRLAASTSSGNRSQ